MRNSTTCDICDSKLESVTTGGWIDKHMIRSSDDLPIVFYGIFRQFEGLQGIFGWIEYPEQIPEGLFCPRGHIGISKEGSIVCDEVGNGNKEVVR